MKANQIITKSNFMTQKLFSESFTIFDLKIIASLFLLGLAVIALWIWNSEKKNKNDN
jgi:hypothetical protein